MSVRNACFFETCLTLLVNRQGVGHANSGELVKRHAAGRIDVDDLSLACVVVDAGAVVVLEELEEDVVSMYDNIMTRES
jgi:hypothetical protein